MDAKKKCVIVFDKDWVVLMPTRPGKARILVKEGKADFVCVRPPAVRLRYRVRNLEGGVAMEIRNLNEYLAKTDTIIVQNVSGGQVSMVFYDENGRVEPFSLPVGTDPVRLTDFIPIELIRKSVDFRKLVQRKPPAIRLLSEEEYEAYYRAKASRSGKSPEEIEEEVKEKVYAFTYKKSELLESSNVSEEVEKTKEMISIAEKGEVSPGIHPRVMQVVLSLNEGSMDASDALYTLNILQELGVDDYRYIYHNVKVESLKKWALQKLSELGVEEVEEKKTVKRGRKKGVKLGG